VCSDTQLQQTLSPNPNLNNGSELFISSSSNALNDSETENDQTDFGDKNRTNTADFNVNEHEEVVNKLETSRRTISIEDISDDNKKSIKQSFDFLTDQNPPLSTYGLLNASN
jgi:hypothetical protein